MYILEYLWYGNLTPASVRHRPFAEYQPHYQTLMRCNDALRAELSEAGLAALNDHEEAELQISCLSACDSFLEGFRVGALLILDLLSLSPIYPS